MARRRPAQEGQVRWARAEAYRHSAAAVARFRDSARPCSGIRTVRSVCPHGRSRKAQRWQESRQRASRVWSCGRSFLNRLRRRPGFDNEPVTLRIVIPYPDNFCDDPPGVQPS